MADPAFAGAGTSPGLELWRIEKLAPVKLDEIDGRFHVGDSYILLSTKKSKTSNALTWAIHFWLGSETSQDESGVAAYKSVELDESLGGGPVQYRELQNHESDLFMSYFKKIGIEYLPGGVESGFQHVERDQYPTRLLHCKGKRSVRCQEVPCNTASLNTGDVFILDMGLRLFLFNGKDANRQEKAKGVEMTQKIRNQRGARPVITFMDDEPDAAEFWGALGGQIEVTDPGTDDAAAEGAAAAELTLHRVTDAGGEVQINQEGAGKLRKDMLDSKDAFIVDNGATIFVWTGRQCTKQEKMSGMSAASEFITKGGRPEHTQVVRVVEGGEPAEFKGLFESWDPPFQLKGWQPSGNVAAAAEEKEVDIAALQSGRQMQDKPVDDGTGKLEIWGIENMDTVEYPLEKYGQFYGGDSYVLLYTYMQGTIENMIVYFWQGRDSSTDEKATSALKAKELDDKYGDRPVQVRVVQGKEPAHFRQLFKGRMIVHSGGKASGFKNRQDQDTIDDDGISLYHVKGTDALNTCGTQVDEKASNLNSADCFTLVTPTHVYAWMGSGSNDEEKATATRIAEILQTHTYTDGPPPPRELVVLNEGSEPDDFWAAVGGKAEYPSLPAGEDVAHDARLFACSTATGRFEVEEVYDFAQEDLNDEDVFLLDTYTSLFVWVGSQSTEQEKRDAMTVAHKFNSEAADGRDPDAPVLRVNAGAEPGLFTQHFVAWDAGFAEKNKFVDPYEAKLAAARAEKEAAAAAEEPAPAPVAAAPQADFRPIDVPIPYDELITLPASEIDPTKKEMYLSDAEFQEKFGIGKAEFAKLPKWKVTAKKKELKLF